MRCYSPNDASNRRALSTGETESSWRPASGLNGADEWRPGGALAIDRSIATRSDSAPTSGRLRSPEFVVGLPPGPAKIPDFREVARIDGAAHFFPQASSTRRAALVLCV